MTDLTTAAERSDRISRIIEDYQGGMTLREVGERYGVTRQAIEQTLKAQGIKRRGRGGKRTVHAEEARRLYEAGGSYREVALALGTSQSSVRRSLVLQGVELRSPARGLPRRPIPEGFEEAYCDGASFTDLYNAFEVYQGAIYRWLRELGLPLRGSGAPGRKRKSPSA